MKLLLEQLRFPDGTTLKDVLVQKQMEKEFHKKLNDIDDGANQQDHEEEQRQIEFLNELENLERRSSLERNDEDDDDDDDDDGASDRSFLVNAIDRDLLEGNMQHIDEGEEDDYHFGTKQTGNTLHDKELEMER